MSNGEAEIAFNAAIRRVLQRIGRDDGSSSVRLARALVARCGSHGKVTDAHVVAALRESSLVPRRDFGVSQQDLVGQLQAEFHLLRPTADLKGQLERFRRLAIRQLARDIPAGQEAPARSHLQVFLEANHDTFREVETGRGRTDILVGARDGEVIEVKLWNDQTYFDDGLDELKEYLRTEGKAHGWYVVFDHSGTYFDGTRHDYQVHLETYTIDVMWIAMPTIAASQLGRERRRRGRERPKS